MTKKDESDIGDFEDVFNSVTHTSGPCLLLVITTQHNMQTDHVDIFQDFTQGEFLEDDDQKERFTPPTHPSTMKTPSVVTSLNGLFMEYPPLSVFGLQ